MKKSVFGVLLIAVMIFGAFPHSVWAQEVSLLSTAGGTTGEQAADETSVASPSAVTKAQTGGCNTMEELRAELDRLAAQDEGGTVTVNADLFLTEDDYVYLNAKKPVTIELGNYGIIVPGNADLILSGSLTLTGSGTVRPLLSIHGFVSTIEGATIIAAGENAVAVRVTGGQWITNRAIVKAVGPNACAVEAVEAEKMELYRAQLVASGENSLCIRSTDPVQLIFSRAESSGILIEAPGLILDGSVASPKPNDAQVIRRVAVAHDTLSAEGLWIEAGSSVAELDELLEWWLFSNTFEYGLYIDQAFLEEPILYFTGMSWSGDEVDPNIPGVYWFTGKAKDPDLGGVILPVKRVPLHVADPKRPAIISASTPDDGVSLNFLRPIIGADQLTLWYSYDEGTTWHDAAELPEMRLEAERAFLPWLPKANRDYLFRLAVAGGPMAGMSNTFRFLYYDNGWGWGGGGDWDGGDRDDQGELPPADGDDPLPDLDTPDRGENEHSSQRNKGRGGRKNRSDSELFSAPPAEPTTDSALTSVSDSDFAPTLPIDAVPTSGITPIPDVVPVSDPIPVAHAVSTAVRDATAATASPAPLLSQRSVPAEATVFLTAAELQDQIEANPNGVTLLDGKLKVFVPAKLLHDPVSNFAARLEQPAPNQFEVRFWSDGIEVTNFDNGAFTVTVPVDTALGAKPSCKTSAGSEITAVDFTEGQASFELTATGMYTVSAITLDSEPDRSAKATATPTDIGSDEAKTPTNSTTTLIMLTIAGVILMVAGFAVLLYRRRGKR